MFERVAGAECVLLLHDTPPLAEVFGTIAGARLANACPSRSLVYSLSLKRSPAAKFKRASPTGKKLLLQVAKKWVFYLHALTKRAPAVKLTQEILQTGIRKKSKSKAV